MSSSKNPPPSPDADEHKGAVEDDSPHLPGERPEPHGSMSGQIGHRNADELTDDNDSDYPEPGFSPEHSGQHE